MRTFPAESGPFLQRYHFAAEEFEVIASQELRSVDLLPDVPAPIRVDRFIEKRFDIVPEYDDLPHGLVGFTRFDLKGPAEVVVARDLADDGGQAAERRIKAPSPTRQDTLFCTDSYSRRNYGTLPVH